MCHSVNSMSSLLQTMANKLNILLETTFIGSDVSLWNIAFIWWLKHWQYKAVNLILNFHITLLDSLLKLLFLDLPVHLLLSGIKFHFTLSLYENNKIERLFSIASIISFYLPFQTTTLWFFFPTALNRRTNDRAIITGDFDRFPRFEDHW